MSALLVLLALLSVAMLASREGAFDALVQRAATPVLVALGLALSPTGLGFLARGTLDSLAPAISAGVAWLALLAGLRASAALPAAVRAPEGGRAAGLAVVAALVSTLVAWGIIESAAGLGFAFVDARHTAAAALLVGASLSGMPGERGASAVRTAYAGTAVVVVIAATLVAFFAWQGGTATAIVAGVGVVGAVAVELLLSKDPPVPPAVGYLAMCALVAGTCHLAAVPGAIAGFVLGSVAGPLRALRGEKTAVVDALLLTERPVRIVITVVLAAVTVITVRDAAVGAALGLGVVVVQYFVSLALVDGSSLLERLGATVATSTTPLVAVAAFAGANVVGAQALLPAVIVAVAVADAVAFTMSLAAHQSSRATGARAPSPAGVSRSAP